MRNFSGFFVKSYAILAKREELDLISSFILFALINAISLAEKKEEKNNRINASQSSIVLSYYLLNKKAQSYETLRLLKLRGIFYQRDYFFNLNLIGIMTRTFTGLPRCFPGLNFAFITAATAASSHPAPIPLTTSALTTFPFSSTNAMT
jgi:hypothetical protein